VGTKYIIAGITIIFVATLALAAVVAVLLVSHLKKNKDEPGEPEQYTGYYE